MKLQIKKTTKKFTQSIRTMDMHIQEGVHVTLAGVLTRGWHARTHLKVFLDGQRSCFECVLCIVGSGKQVFPFDISVIHRTPYTESSVAIRSLLRDESRVDSHGLARVEYDTRDARASFSHHALLLSDHSSASILPILEIMTDSAQAHHAASVSQIDTDMLWYLMSRGMSEKKATTLLTEVFLQQDIKNIHDQSFQKKIQKKLYASHTLYA